MPTTAGRGKGMVAAQVQNVSFRPMVEHQNKQSIAAAAPWGRA
jgi:hypothetical protein